MTTSGLVAFDDDVWDFTAVAGLPNVRLLPLQPSERLSELLGMADIHLLPQSPDAADLVLPSKLSGMLASGRPVIATCLQIGYASGFLWCVIRDRWGRLKTPHETSRETSHSVPTRHRPLETLGNGAKRPVPGPLRQWNGSN